MDAGIADGRAGAVAAGIGERLTKGDVRAAGDESIEREAGGEIGEGVRLAERDILRLGR